MADSLTAPQGTTVAVQEPSPEGDSLACLESLCAVLAGRGWTAHLVDARWCGESDVRLCAGTAGGAITVEVLGPCSGASGEDRWHAVRVDRDGTRVVWRGPARPCDEARLLAFVEHLAGPAIPSPRGYAALG